MAIWTVDTWRVAPEGQAHFLDHCRGVSPDRLVLYRDLEDEGAVLVAGEVGEP